MLTLGRAAYQKEQRYAEYAGLSTDDKVNNDIIVNPRNGDIFKEIDTGSVFKYNEESGQWVQQPSTGGGGSQTTGVTSFNGRTGTVTPVATDYPPDLIGAVNKAGDTMSGDLNMGGNKVTGVSSIVANGSTADGLRFESNGATVRVLCGGTTSASFSENAIDAYEHRVVRVGAPINNTDAARKQDVDAVQTAVDSVGDTVNEIIDGTEVLPYLPEDGGTLSGPLNMGNNKITMGATPTETTDVTNKGYVDGVVKVVSDEVDGIIAGTTPISVPIATDTKVGGVLQAAGVTDATNADDIITQFNALLASLRTSGVLQDNT